jgi:hypothetical protein
MISDLENPTFYQALVAYFESIKPKELKNFVVSQSLLNILTIGQLDKIASLWPRIKEDKNYIGTYF